MSLFKQNPAVYGGSIKTPCSCIICRRKINARRTVIDQHWEFHQRTGLTVQNTNAEKKRRHYWQSLMRQRVQCAIDAKGL